MDSSAGLPGAPSRDARSLSHSRSPPLHFENPRKALGQPLYCFLAASTWTRGFAGNSTQPGDFGFQLLGPHASSHEETPVG